MTHVRDALHGYIEMSEEEKNVVDAPQMQRLRRVRQLGLSSLVYPSATHTRFQHSLGTMYLSGRFADSLNLNEETTRELRIAGLLHDSGHGPFSHASEFVAEKHGLSHEQLSCRKVDELEDRFSVKADRVKKIIRGELEIGNVVAGDIDADRMDYLLRDAHSSGLEHGTIDSATIIRLAEIDSRRLVFDEKAVQALESLFTARFHMIRSVYRHHTSNIAEKMLQRALEDYLEDGKLEELMAMDDYEAHNELLDSQGASKKLYSRIKDRELYKRALIWDEDDISRETLGMLEENIEPGSMEEKIAEEAGVRPEEVIVDRPDTPGIHDIDVRVKKEDRVENLSDISPIIGSLEQAEWRMVAMKVYSPEGETEKVRKAAEKVLGDHASTGNKP